MKKLLLFTLILLGLAFSNVNLEAAYNYAFWDTIDSSEAMHVLRVIDNSNIKSDLGVEKPITLGDLRDVFYYEDAIYVSDATSNKIHVFNENYDYVKSLPDASDALGQLNSPQGIHVLNDLLYVADYNNNRIAIFDLTNDRLVQEVKNPNDAIFDNLVFKPLRVSVDRTGRMNVIAYDV